jgi:hypothetical protein
MFSFFILVLSQSMFGFVVHVLLRLNKYLILIISLFLVYYLYINFSVELFFSNSGLVRLYGLFYMFNNLELLTFFGSGVGYSSNIFQSMLSEKLKINEFSGFLADFYIDLGIIGSFIFLAILFSGKPRKIELFVIFSLLYLEFGFSISLFPYIFTFTYLILDNDYSNTRKSN